MLGDLRKFENTCGSMDRKLCFISPENWTKDFQVSIQAHCANTKFAHCAQRPKLNGWWHASRSLNLACVTSIPAEASMWCQISLSNSSQTKRSNANKTSAWTICNFDQLVKILFVRQTDKPSNWRTDGEIGRVKFLTLYQDYVSISCGVYAC